MLHQQTPAPPDGHSNGGVNGDSGHSSSVSTIPLTRKFSLDSLQGRPPSGRYFHYSVLPLLAYASCVRPPSYWSFGRGRLMYSLLFFVFILGGPRDDVGFGYEGILHNLDFSSLFATSLNLNDNHSPSMDFSSNVHEHSNRSSSTDTTTTTASLSTLDSGESSNDSTSPFGLHMPNSTSAPNLQPTSRSPRFLSSTSLTPKGYQASTGMADLQGNDGKNPPVVSRKPLVVGTSPLDHAFSVTFPSLC